MQGIFQKLLVSVLLAVAATCSANEGILTFSNGGLVGYVDGTAGWSFEPLTDISVTSLGCFDYVLTSNNQLPLSVGLWDQSGTLLTSATVTTADPLFDQSRYQSITPVTLIAGQSYYLGAYSSAGSIVFDAETSSLGGFAITSPQIQLGMAALSTNGFSFPNTLQGDPGSALLAPNFQFSSVPEPSFAALAILGLATICRWKQAAKRQT